MRLSKTIASVVVLFTTSILLAFQVREARVPEVPDGEAGTRAVASLLWVDYDRDGYQDLFVVDARGGDRLLRNLGDGRFEETTSIAGLEAAGGSLAAAWGDYDADGYPDLYRIAPGSAGALLRNAGNGTFEDVTSVAGLAHRGPDLDARWIDYDLDDQVDLHVATASGPRLYHNLGGGAFQVGFAVEGAAEVDLARAGLVPTTRVPAGSVEVDAPGADRVRGEEVPVASGRADRGEPGTSGGSRSSAGLAPFAPRVAWARRVGGSTVPATGTGVCVDGLFDQASPGNCLDASSSPTLGSLYPLSPSLNVNPSGRVGVGTTSPGGSLHVVDTLGTGLPTLQLEGTGAGGSNCFVKFGTVAGSPRILELPSEELQFLSDGGSSFGPGNVGIHTSPGAHALTVYGTDENAVRLIGPEGSFGHGAQLNFGDADYAYIEEDADDHLLIEARLGTRVTSSVSGTPLEVDGRCRVDELEIVGGADLVEAFAVEGERREPGTVLVIDPDHPGALVPSAGAYDPRVAGVVSGAGGVKPGILMSQEAMADGDTLVALIGRVYVRCSAENGAIAPGDLLTTASAPGFAMRATDRQRLPGAVLGKALSSLDDDTGLVLVLVNLQ